MKRKRQIKTPMKTMLILTATEVEEVYFNQVRKDCRYTNMTVKSATNIKSFSNLLMQASRERTKNRYSSVWVFFSFKDENLEIEMEDLEELKALAKKKRIKLCFVQPNLSLWFYLHLTSPNRYIEDEEFIVEQLQKAIKGFSLTKEYLSGEGQNLHLALFSQFSKAIMNERQYNEVCQQKSGIPATNIDQLYVDIHEICGNGDITQNQKTLSKK